VDIQIVKRKRSDFRDGSQCSPQQRLSYWTEMFLSSNSVKILSLLPKRDWTGNYGKVGKPGMEYRFLKHPDE
jgi:hypothetical protein